MHEAASATYLDTLQKARLDVFSLLLDRGADPGLHNHEGLTPLAMLDRRLSTAPSAQLLVAFLRHAQAKVSAGRLEEATVEIPSRPRGARRI